MKVSEMELDDLLDSLADGVDQDADLDPVLIFAGEPPEYQDRLPDDYNVCIPLGRHFGHKIVKYRPRHWSYKGDGVFVMHDGHLGDSDDGDAEFEVEITPDDYVAYRIPRPQSDSDLSIPTRFTVEDSIEDIDGGFDASELSYTDSDGVTVNGRWHVLESETMVGDHVELEHQECDDALVASLPTESIGGNDPGEPPECGWCNNETSVKEREWLTMEGMMDEGMDPRDHLDEIDGTVKADYALVDTESAEVVAYSCHSCIQGVPVIDG